MLSQDTIRTLLIYNIGVAVSAVLVAVLFYIWVWLQNPGSDRARRIAKAISRGAMTYLFRLYKFLVILAISLASLILMAKGPDAALAFLCGSLCSATAGFLGMSIAVIANVRTATTASGKKGLSRSFKVAFRAGSVMGLATVGLALLGMSSIYLVTNDPEVVLSFSFGASSLALLAKVGGGIFTKTADMTADLVGKVEQGIPEDDPRNPVVIADLVGDIVGDVAGTGADIFDSYVASSVAIMILGMSFGNGAIIVIPLLLNGLGIISSFIGILFVKVNEDEETGRGVTKSLNRGTFVTCTLFAVFSAILVQVGGYDYGLLWSTLIGLIAGMMIGMISDYFTSDHYPVIRTAFLSESGPSINIISGLSFGLLSSFLSMIVIGLAIIGAHGVYGIYGVGIAAVGMLAVSGTVVAGDAFGPIVDNSQGIAEMSKMGSKALIITDILDASGNTTKAITKGFAIGAAALTSVGLLLSYAEMVYVGSDVPVVNILDPTILAGAFIGVGAPLLFSYLLFQSVISNASKLIEHVRIQFQDPAIKSGIKEPDYNACIDLASKNALVLLIKPGLLALFFPVIVGLFLGPSSLAGFLAGSIIFGVPLAIVMDNAGGLWDNAKKYIASGHYGGKGSLAHIAAVIGDMVGDPFKDTVGPSLNTLLTLIGIVAIFIASIIKDVQLGFGLKLAISVLLFIVLLIFVKRTAIARFFNLGYKKFMRKVLLMIRIE